MFTFGSTAKESYDRHIHAVTLAEEYISNKCNRKSNLLIQKRCTDFKKVDEDSGIHGNHIKSNAKATWRTILSKEQIEHVNEVFKEELEHFGYE